MRPTWPTTIARRRPAIRRWARRKPPTWQRKPLAVAGARTAAVRLEAARALRIFKRLRIPDVIGQPTMAEACGPWFFPIVEALFGSYDPETHRRMIRRYFELIPKGNSKSSMAAR
jgi:hypothetical protein